MEHGLPAWRSILFVPAHVSRFVDKAHERGADAIALDLEDSVPLEQKTDARQQLPGAIAMAGKGGADIVVRINSSLRLAAADLECVVVPGVNAICIPKVIGPSQLQWIDDCVTELEIREGIPVGQIRLIAMLESVEAMRYLDDIASSTPRLVAMTLGSEDFSASAGMQPDPQGLLVPNQQVVFAARAANILPLGFVGSIGDYSDLEVFRQRIRQSRRLGLYGAFCIHPDQVRIMNEEFLPSPEEVAEAQSIIDAYEKALAQKRGAAEYGGKMIDAPVVARALETLESYKRSKFKNT